MQDQLLSLLISLLPPVVLILAVVIVYLRGRSRNYRIMNRIKSVIEDEPEFIESLSILNESITGRTYSVKVAKIKKPDDDSED
ncbi:MAG: hypothetical protein ACFFD1_04745, partial [Candidatus Thorarchaeota archaeon]